MPCGHKESPPLREGLGGLGYRGLAVPVKEVDPVAVEGSAPIILSGSGAGSKREAAFPFAGSGIPKMRRRLQGEPGQAEEAPPSLPPAPTRQGLAGEPRSRPPAHEGRSGAAGHPLFRKSLPGKGLLHPFAGQVLPVDLPGSGLEERGSREIFFRGQSPCRARG